MVRKRGKLRIIGGQWRGRQLPVVDSDTLRPTPDRVRETLFNWLQNEIAGSHCVDLFAGSGALAFEALSRGAEHVTAVEHNPRACAQMRETAIALGTKRLNVICADVGDYLRHTGAQPNPLWQIVFVDPPYALGYPPPQWSLLEGHPSLMADALVYLESHARFSETGPGDTTHGWTERRQKIAGEVCYRLLQRGNTTTGA